VKPFKARPLIGDIAAQRLWGKRNALFVRARVAGAMNDWTRAESFCQAASGHSYRAQGGDGLLFWGDVLTRLDRLAEAREAYAFAIERDRQSQSARLAAERLGESWTCRQVDFETI